LKKEIINNNNYSIQITLYYTKVVYILS